jgi:hypothetical protein
MVGMITGSIVIRAIVGALYAITTSYVALTTIQLGIEIVKDIISAKKKIKTNEIKKIKTNEIRIKVKYLKRSHPIFHTQVFVAETLKGCIKQALLIAQRFNYIIVEMDLLTTEE